MEGYLYEQENTVKGLCCSTSCCCLLCRDISFLLAHLYWERSSHHTHFWHLWLFWLPGAETIPKPLKHKGSLLALVTEDIGGNFRYGLIQLPNDIVQIQTLSMAEFCFLCVGSMLRLMFFSRSSRIELLPMLWMKKSCACSWMLWAMLTNPLGLVPESIPLAIWLQRPLSSFTHLTSAV